MTNLSRQARLNRRRRENSERLQSIAAHSAHCIRISGLRWHREENGQNSTRVDRADKEQLLFAAGQRCIGFFFTAKELCLQRRATNVLLLPGPTLIESRNVTSKMMPFELRCCAE
jgi:hypothetical protein